VVHAVALLGVKKVRLTGGEPLLRPRLENLVRLLAAVPSVDDISLTTNGLLLAGQAATLKEAGLKRVNVSLDTLRPERFATISGRPCLDEVLEGIEAAREAGLEPVKINMVVIRGTNDDEVMEFAGKAKEEGWHVRYVEYMPFLEKDVDLSRLVSVKKIMKQMESEFGQLEPVLTTTGGGPAHYYRLPGVKGTIGFIGPLSGYFCEECNRFRVTADGLLRPCLLSDDEVDLKEALRRGADTAELVSIIEKAVATKPERYNLPRVSVSGRQMRQIGG
jgi:cyclic pyranopterin phosphate synthase